MSNTFFQGGENLSRETLPNCAPLVTGLVFLLQHISFLRKSPKIILIKFSDPFWRIYSLW